MRTSSTFSILFWIYSTRAINNKANIYMRITLNGQRVNIGLKRKVYVTKWDVTKQRVNGTDKVSQVLNLYLNEEQSKIYRIFEKLKSEDKPFNCQMIKAWYLGESKMHYSFRDLIAYHNEKMQHKLHRNTIRQYETSQQYMFSYILKEYKKTDISLTDLNYGFIIGFENFLRSYIPKRGQSKIGNNTAMKHIKRLRKMVTLAYRLEWLQRDPFINFKVKIEKKEREFLTSEELHNIEGLYPSIERLLVVRDLFVFSCYTGISYSDIIRLTDQNIVIGVDGNPWIMAQRVKTGTPLKFHYCLKPVF